MLLDPNKQTLYLANRKSSGAVVKHIPRDDEEIVSEDFTQIDAFQLPVLLRSTLTSLSTGQSTTEDNIKQRRIHKCKIMISNTIDRLYRLQHSHMNRPTHSTFHGRTLGGVYVYNPRNDNYSLYTVIKDKRLKLQKQFHAKAPKVQSPYFSGYAPGSLYFPIQRDL